MVIARNQLSEDIVATPAIAGNTIYLRTLHMFNAFAGR